MMTNKLIKIYSCHRETILYVFWGGITTIIGVGLFALLLDLGFEALIANTISVSIALVFAYIVNKIFVFCSHNWDIHTLLKESLSFGTGRLVSYFLETGLLAVMIYGFHFGGLFSKMIATLLVIITNYCISKYIVFNNK